MEDFLISGKGAFDIWLGAFRITIQGVCISISNPATMPSKCPHCRRACKGNLKRHMSQCLENPRSCNKFKQGAFHHEVLVPNGIQSAHSDPNSFNWGTSVPSFANSNIPPGMLPAIHERLLNDSFNHPPLEVTFDHHNGTSVSGTSVSEPAWDDSEEAVSSYTASNGFDNQIGLDQTAHDVICLPMENDPIACISSNALKAYTKIYDVLRRCRVPHYGYDAIVSTIFSELTSGNLSSKEIPYSRRAFLRYISQRFPTAIPVSVQVRLDNRWNTMNQSGNIRGVDQTHVITFDFKQQLEDILGDPSLFGDLDNLVVNRDPSDPGAKWLPYDQNNGSLYEVLDGHWYQNYAKNLIKHPGKEFCIPIGLYVDESQTVVYQRYSFQPLVMFPLILNCKTRNRVSSSRVLALIPDLDAKSTAVKIATRAGGRENIGTSMRNYHQCMSAALASLKHYQKNGISTFVRLGNEVALRELKVPVAFILGDAKSQDTLCGRFLSRNTKRMCRACNVTFQNSSNPLHKCKYILSNKFEQRIDIALDLDGKYSKMEKKKATASLHRRSVHAVENSFRDVDFAGFPRGIYGCTPHDLMHLFLEGVLKYCIRLFIHRYTSSQKAVIDQIVSDLFDQFQSSEKANMPRYCFIKGMTNLTMITADEEVGMALVVVIVGQTERGKRAFLPGLDEESDNCHVDEEGSSSHDSESESHQEEGTNCSVSTQASFASDIMDQNDLPSACTFESFIQVFEMMLCFHAWYKSETPIKWDESSFSTISHSIRSMMKSIIEVFPRNEGNGWNIQKLHELLHIPTDIMNFGSPKNFDTGIYENRLIHIGKINAKFCQKRGPHVFQSQLAQRIHEQQCFEKTKRILFQPNSCNVFQFEDVCREDDQSIEDEEFPWEDDEAHDSIPLKDSYPQSQVASRYKVTLDHDGRPVVEWLTKAYQSLEIAAPILHAIQQIIANNNLDDLVVISEIMREGQIFRAHPNYRKAGNWFDWAIMQFPPNSSDRLLKEYNRRNKVLSDFALGQRPVKLLGFF